MRVLQDWAIDVVCNNCGIKIEVEVNDLKVVLVGNYGQTGNLLAYEIPIYSVGCLSCKQDVRVQEGFSGILPDEIKKTAEKNNRIDLGRIKYDRI